MMQSSSRDAGSGDTRPAKAARVVLVSMPFGVLYSPSLALGILQARLGAAEISTVCRHFTIDYAARIGVDKYNRLSAGFPRTTDLLGDWIFSHALAPKTAAQQERYLSHVFGRLAPARTPDGMSDTVANELRVKSIEQILDLAERARDFADFAAREILAYEPAIVGFTSVFEQNMASLAVAARLREAAPSVRILFGGANCEAAMGRELARAYPFIDFVISGEVDQAIVPLVSGLLNGREPRDNPELQSLIEFTEDEDSFLQTKMVNDLSGQPRPGFDDYFRDLGKRPGIADRISVHIPMETSRGCWWGQKMHCTFCGLNGATMAFRSKQVDEVVRDIAAYAASYPGRKICFVDNIMDHKYFETLLPQLAQSELDLDLFYEIKSNVSKRQVKALRDAGIRHVQPGIESFSNRVLRLMKKGVSAGQNLQLLKWCTEYGIKVDWNLLWGFPGEDPADYREMAAMAPLLCHLQPPSRGSRIRLDRFSPNFRDSQALGFSGVRPYEAYFDVYDGLPARAIHNIAYFFRANDQLDGEIEGYTRDLSTAIEQWQAGHATSGFFYLEQGDRIVLVDRRSLRMEREPLVLDGLAAQVFASCDTTQSIAALTRELGGVAAEQIEETLRALLAKGLMWTDGTQFLSLAVSFTNYLESRHSARLEEGIDEFLLGRIATASR